MSCTPARVAMGRMRLSSWPSGVRFEAGPTTLSGDLVQQASGLIDGQLQLRSSNITTAAALFLTEARTSEG